MSTPSREEVTAIPTLHTRSLTAEEMRVIKLASPARYTARYTREPVGRDFYTTTDSAGYAAYADAIARAIQHKDTMPPLTIGIKGSWGAGKTSLMRMVQNRLEWPPKDDSPDDREQHSDAREPKLRSICLTPRGRDLTFLNKRADAEASSHQSEDKNANSTSDRVQNRTVLRALKELPDRDDDEHSTIKAVPISLPAENIANWRPTVWFNPWMYQTGEQVWAGLAYEIIKQITGRMSVAEREHFWLRLNLKRIDQQAVRRKIYAMVLDRVLPYAAAALIIVVVGVVLLLAGIPNWITALLAGGAPAAVGVVAVVQVVNVLSSRVSGRIAQLVKPAAVAKQFTAEALHGVYNEVVESPDYRSKTGFFYLVWADVQRVLDLVATEKRPVVVFIDDLDRCSPGTVVQVIEAINLFLAGEFRKAIFVTAMEPEMVAAHIEAAYSDLAKALRDTGVADGEEVNLGWRFLEKIVQLPLTLPAMEVNRITSYFESLLPGTVAGLDEHQPDVAEPEVQKELDEPAMPLREAVRMSGQVTDPSHAESVSTATSVQAQALRQVVEQQLSIDNDDVREIIANFGPWLAANPREIKRFVNVFRFLVMIDCERGLRNLSSAGDLNAIAKIAVLHIRWPEAIGILARPCGVQDQRTVYEFMEDPGNISADNAEAGPESPTRVGRRRRRTNQRIESPVDKITDSDLRTFINSPPAIGAVIRNYL